MVNVESRVWTSCKKKVKTMKKSKPENKEMKMVRILGIIYILIGSVNLGIIINFFEILNII